MNQTDKIFKHYIFLADVHLNPKNPGRTKKFLDFLASLPKNKETVLYILGDLFDFWIGPKHIDLPDHSEVLKQLKKLTREELTINFIHGNRDFQIGREFSQATGVNVLGDNAIIKLGDQKVWLTHGDLLCTNDTGYTSYRRLARTRLVQSAYQSLPRTAGYGIGSGLRRLSAKLVAQKPEQTRAIVLKTVRSYFDKGYDVIICGHIHHAGRKIIKTSPDQNKLLFTLGLWSEQTGHFLTYDEKSGFNLCQI
ncbi:MAG: UDP-2,3-diacylglucosamine diphosphatase [Planctomycetota bacterium]